MVLSPVLSSASQVRVDAATRRVLRRRRSGRGARRGASARSPGQRRLAVPACGSDGDGGASSADVERSLKADLSGGGDRVVDLGTSPPKLVECAKDGKSWRCRVTATSGESVVRIAQADPESGRTLSRVCGRVDN
jgi:hypothetical protein